MKKLKPLLLLLLPMIVLYSSCLEDDCTREMRYIQHTPVFLSTAELNDIHTTTPRALEDPGKLYFYNNYIFVNERNKGIHIIDNSNPATPQNIAFINIPANVDMAIQGSYLYADNGDDLITLDISDPTNAQLVDRKADVFPPLYEYDEGWLAYYNQEVITEITNCNASNFTLPRGVGGVFFTMKNASVSTASASAGAVSTGVGGSMARFTLAKGHLYAVDRSSMNIFDVSNPAMPTELNDVSVGWGIETIFPHGDHLFIGSEAGMYIFDNSTPSAPTQLSRFEHARACDPVFVKDNYAYVTLRSGTFCEGFTNQLDLIDITDLTQPVLEKTFQMSNPHGLSIKDDNLYLCEGDFGLKAFDISDPKKLGNRQRSHLKDLHAYDAINVPNSDLLLVIGADGLYQYDAQNANNITLVSKIEVVR